MERLTPLEAQVIRMLLAGDGALLASLRAQAERIVAVSRQMTGVGFFTRFHVIVDDADLVSNRSFKLGDVGGSADGVLYGLGFLLWIERGRLTMLEGYTYSVDSSSCRLWEFRLRFIRHRPILLTNALDDRHTARASIPDAWRATP